MKRIQHGIADDSRVRRFWVPGSIHHVFTHVQGRELSQRGLVPLTFVENKFSSCSCLLIAEGLSNPASPAHVGSCYGLQSVRSLFAAAQR